MRRGLALVFVAMLVAAASAVAKEGAQAHLLSRLPLQAKANTLISIRWTVDVSGPDGKRVAFRAAGMFARLIGRNGASTTATAPQNAPPYGVRIRVPSGGIRSIVVGLRGRASTPTGTHPAPVLFPITNNLLLRKP